METQIVRIARIGEDEGNGGKFRESQGSISKHEKIGDNDLI